MEPASGSTVLIIEAERDVVDLLALNLRKAGFATMDSKGNTAAGSSAQRSSFNVEYVLYSLVNPSGDTSFLAG